MVVNFLCLNVASSCGLMVLVLFCWQPAYVIQLVCHFCFKITSIWQKKPPPNPILPYKTTNNKRKEKYVCLVVFQMSGFGNTVTHTFCQNINKKVTPNQGNIKIAQTHKKTVGMRYRPKSIIYTVKCKPTLAFEEDKEERRWNLTETEENDDVLRDRCKWIRRFFGVIFSIFYY